MLKWKVPVSIITGYLGVGKTTLLKKIISDTKKKIAILMNEFGEIGIDTKIMKGKNVDMMELLGGCVCCSLTGELTAAIEEILKKVKPDMIVIETTGVAEPDAMIANIDDVEGVRLDSVITIVDADAFVNFPRLGHTGRVQIENADVIILNKVDLVHTSQIDEIEHALQELNPRAPIIKATYSNLDTRVLFGLETERAVAEHGTHDATIIDSFVYRSDRIHERSRFLKFASDIPKEVYRAKGFVNFSDGTYLFNFVNGRYDMSKSDKQDTEIVFIGVDIDRLEQETIESLRSCQA